MLSTTIQKAYYPDEYPNYFSEFVCECQWTDFQINLKLEEKKYFKSATILKSLGIFFFLWCEVSFP